MKENAKINEIFVCGDSNCAIDFLKEQEVDLISLDVNVGNENGFYILEEILSFGYVGKVIFIASEDNKNYERIARTMGANAYVSKRASVSELKDAISGVVNDYVFFKKHSTFYFEELSSQELFVFNKMTEGKSISEIAKVAGISPKSVCTYKSRILRKYNSSSIVEVCNLRKLIDGLSLRSV